MYCLRGFLLGCLLGQRLLPGLDVGDHLVERIDENADLVRGRVLDAHGEVALGHGPGGLGQLFDGHGDSLGDMEADHVAAKTMRR